MKTLLALAVLLISASGVLAQDSRGRQRQPPSGGGKSGGSQSGGSQSGGSQSGGGSGQGTPTRRDGGQTNSGGNYDAPRSNYGGARRRVPRPTEINGTTLPQGQPRGDGSIGNAVRRDSLPPRSYTDHFGGYVPHHPNDRGWNQYYWHTYGGRRYCHYVDGYGVSWYYWYYDDGYYTMRYHDGYWWRHDARHGRWVYLYGGDWYYRSGSTVYLYEENRGSYSSVDDDEWSDTIEPAKISITANLGSFGLSDGGQGSVVAENRGYLDFDGNMSGVTAAAEVNVGLTNHIEAGLGAGYQRASVNTRYTDYVFEDGGDIRQNLRLTNVPVNVNVKVMPWGRDQRIQPYVGAGVQVNKWNYQESGQFIDFASENYDIYKETYKASGVAVGPIALVGLKVPLNKKVALGAEYRHQWAKSKLPGEAGFAGDHLDLGGGTFQAGLTINLK